MRRDGTGGGSHASAYSSLLRWGRYRELEIPKRQSPQYCLKPPRRLICVLRLLVQMRRGFLFACFLGDSRQAPAGKNRVAAKGR